MLNSGTLFTLAALSLVALGQSHFVKPAPAAHQPVAPVAPTAPRMQLVSLIAETDDAGSAIAKAIEEIQANPDLSAAAKERIIASLRKAQSALDSHHAPIAPHMFHFDDQPGTAPKAMKDVRIRIKGKDGKVYELNNPSEKELKEFQEKMRKEFGDMKFDFKFDSKALEQMRKELGDMKFEFKSDPKFMEKFGKDFKFDAKELKRLRDEFQRVAPRANPSTRTEIQRELEEIQRERAELDAREKALRDMLERSKSALPTSAV